MRKIKLSNGKTIEVECLSCALTSGLIEPEGGVVVETEHFHAHQDVAYPIEGLVILASKRHLYSLDELTKDERIDFIEALATDPAYRKGMHLNAEKVAGAVNQKFHYGKTVRVSSCITQMRRRKREQDSKKEKWET